MGEVVVPDNRPTTRVAICEYIDLRMLAMIRYGMMV
jgi:hypothetical protein